MPSPISKEFLFEYFRGKATSIQKQVINDWIKQPENEEFFFQCMEEWERLHPQYLVDVKDGIGKFRTRQSARPANGTDDTYREAAPRKNNLLLWAASVVLVLGAAGWFSRESMLYRHFMTRPGEVAAFTLPDGSVVTLNANSKLKVSRFWKLASRREAFLSGEAEFKVARNERAEKFVVKTGNQVDIEVVGTVFTVFNRHRHTEVLLNEGKVRLRQQTGDSTQTIEMIPGDKIRVNANQQMVLEKVENPSLESMWKEHRFSFDQTSLGEVALLFSDLYSLEVKFEHPDLLRYTISGSFLAKSADELLESVSATSGLTCTRKNQTVTFSQSYP